jgi:hypothetical protein
MISSSVTAHRIKSITLRTQRFENGGKMCAATHINLHTDDGRMTVIAHLEDGVVPIQVYILAGLLFARWVYQAAPMELTMDDECRFRTHSSHGCVWAVFDDVEGVVMGCSHTHEYTPRHLPCVGEE